MRKVKEIMQYVAAYVFAGVCVGALLAVMVLTIKVLFAYSPAGVCICLALGITGAVAALVIDLVSKVKREREIKDSYYRNRRKCMEGQPL